MRIYFKRIEIEENFLESLNTHFSSSVFKNAVVRELVILMQERKYTI